MPRRNLFAEHRRESEKRATRHAISVFFSRACSHYIRASIYIMYLHNTGHDIYRSMIHYFAVTLEELKTDACKIFQILNAFSVNNEWRE